MRATLVAAHNAVLTDEVPVGAVVVYGGEHIGRGYNRTVIDNFPSSYPITLALRAIGDALNRHRLLDAILYVATSRARCL